ncbi:MAG: 30S ribosomal protein S8 [Elusimicrobiota bacterium]|nr:30S ribosomal protein S8 [Elusimicrobiota bacterium]
MDMVSNMLTSIRNANMKTKERVDIPFSTFKADIAKILVEEGFVSNHKVLSVEVNKKTAKRKIIRITLKYTKTKKPVLKGLKRVSKPSLRVYRSHDNIPKIKAAFGVTILSTSKGLLTDRNARKERVGGEVLCYVW